MVALGDDRNEDCENIGVCSTLEHFAEVEDVILMIDDIKNIHKTPELEAQYEKLNAILKQYYEQPHLLDPHLDTILAKFVALIKSKDEPMDLIHAAFNYMYLFVRIRGYKVVVRHLPHEVSDLLMVLAYLEQQDPNDRETWKSRFVLLLWLSIVVIIPFHMSRLDGFTPTQKDDPSKRLTVMERILNICKIYAMSKDSCAEASAFLTSKFLIRSDVKDMYMGPFFDWAIDINSNLKEEHTIHFGVLASVAAVLKHGKRDDLLPYAPRILEWVTKQNFKDHKAILVRKYGAKIVQRIGLVFLRPRVTSWRYTRGARSLTAALSGTNAAAAGDVSTPASPPDDEDYEDIPQEVEEACGLLVAGLCDADTVVRWSCAKGLGRLGGRLPPSAAAELCAAVLELWRERPRDPAAHGAALATAELVRRGLVDSTQLDAAVSCCVLAVRRDEARACGGSGRGARDAACYAAWAFARAYSPHELQPHANSLAPALIATACFDREINCRRAASAAFQENVGRHGQFPHGIDVLTAADFHSVGPRSNAYLVVAPKIAQYPEYTKHLIDHLVELKVTHWDCAIRELAASALFKITARMPEYMATEVLTILLGYMESGELHVRHGAMMAIGTVIHALTLLPQEEDNQGQAGWELIPSSSVEAAVGLVGSVAARRQFLGLGGELMRQAAARHIASLAAARAPAAKALDTWLTLLEGCLSHEVQVIREKAIIALPLVVKEYLSIDDLVYNGVTAKERRKQLVLKYCEQLSSVAVNGIVLRMGFARAVGSLPKFLLKEYLPLVVSSLIECTKVTDATVKWAEARRDAVIGLTEVCQTVGVIDGVESVVGQIFEAFLDCLSEYTTDLRGDIGAWVREASMSGLLSLCRQCAAEAPHVLSARVMAHVCCDVSQQAVEKIDRTRAVAGTVFTALLYNEPQIPNIPEHEALKRIFPPESVVDLKPKPANEDLENTEEPASESSTAILWLFPAHTMPKFVQLLAFPDYRYSVIKGLVVSAGELTESLVKHTTQSINSFLSSMEMESLKAVCDTIIQVFADNLHVKRLMGPIFNFLDRLMSSGAISPILEDSNSTFASDVLKYLKLELSGGKNIYKLLDSINVLCQLIQVGGEVCNQSLVRLSICVCHGDKYVRRCAAARLYEALSLYGDVLETQHLAQVMSILEETDWERDVSELRPIRNEMCDLLGIKRPAMKQEKPS